MNTNKSELLEKICAAPITYNTPEYETAREMIKAQRDYVKELQGKAQGTRKNSAEHKQLELASTQLKSMEQGLKDLPQPQYSAAYLMAQIISEMVISVLNHRESWLGIQKKMLLNPVSTIESYMDDIVADQVIDVELTRMLSIMKKAAAEDKLTLDYAEEIWNHFKTRHMEEVHSFMRRCSSRSTSAVHNLVEDLTFQAKENLYDDGLFGGYGWSMVKHVKNSSTIVCDEQDYLINWAALDEVIAL